MIDVYFWMTPNGYKVTIALEELGMPYNVIPINIGKGDQFKPEFLKISPNNKIPAMVDSDGPDGKPISLFESGAILIYLADKSRKLMPQDPRGRYNVLEWLMFQMASVGPMLGQAHHFRRYAPEKIEYAINRYTNEAKRIYGVIDKRLFEELNDRVSAALRDTPARDLERNLRALLASWFDRFDLVAREDFDVQKKLLEDAQARLVQLEERIARIEAGRAPGSK